MHPNEIKFIDKKSKELAAQTCKSGDAQCLTKAQLYWSDQLTAEAEAADDSKLSLKRKEYLKQVAATSQVAGAEGQISGGAAKYLSDAQIARAAESRIPSHGLRCHFTELVGTHPLAVLTLANALRTTLSSLHAPILP